jgi:bifunctional non-homologous end joining protein LigD
MALPTSTRYIAASGEVQLYVFDILALDGDDQRRLPLSMRKTNLARLLARQPEGIFVAPFEQGEIGPDLFRAAWGATE